MHKILKAFAPLLNVSIVLSMIPVSAQTAPQKTEIPSHHFLDEVSYDSIVELVDKLKMNLAF